MPLPGGSPRSPAVPLGRGAGTAGERGERGSPKEPEQNLARLQQREQLTSWNKRLGEVSWVETVEVQHINVTAPFTLLSEIRPCLIAGSALEQAELEKLEQVSRRKRGVVRLGGAVSSSSRNVAGGVAAEGAAGGPQAQRSSSAAGSSSAVVGGVQRPSPVSSDLAPSLRDLGDAFVTDLGPEARNYSYNQVSRDNRAKIEEKVRKQYARRMKFVVNVTSQEGQVLVFQQ